MMSVNSHIKNENLTLATDMLNSSPNLAMKEDSHEVTDSR